MMKSDQDEFECVDTLETLRDIARACRAKTPKSLQSDRKLPNEYSFFGGVVVKSITKHKPAKKTSISANRGYSELCEFCGENTEIARERAAREGVASHPYCDVGSRTRPSWKYCFAHRPKYANGTRNSHYLWAVNHRAEFETELSRLALQARWLSKPAAETGDPNLDLFYFKVLGHLANFESDIRGLRNEARTIVNESVNDKKKRVVVMRMKGQSFDSIAQEIGANSRQAVHKALSSLPPKYRFDLATYLASDHDSRALAPCEVKAEQSEINAIALSGFIELLGPIAAQAFTDSHTVDFGANDNGALWSESRTLGMRMIGTLNPSEIEKIIRFAASNFAHEPDSSDDMPKMRLPWAGARFFGYMPAYGEPIFSIRKAIP